jgi:hypothetical protein
VDTQGLMKLGFAFVCACCTRLTSGSSVVRETNCGMTDCGGPLRGRSFPMYQGPMSRQSMATLCFRCGVKAKWLIQTADGGYLAVCRDHSIMLPLKPVEGQFVERSAIR